MNKKLQNILNIIQQSKKLDAEQKTNLIKAVEDADKEFEITAFKLDRTEKVKKTTAILLEETIEELEQKRKAVEAQNRELEIEASLERVRAVAMGMKQPEDMIDVCRIISGQLEILGVTDIRNIQTAIINKKKGTYLNYEYFTQYKTTSILEIVTKLHPVVEEFAKEILKSKDAFFTKTFEGESLKEWIEYRKNTNQNPDPILENAKSVHYYFYSIGPGALGVSTYSPITDQEIKAFKRFRNVFELAYRRFIDIEKAIAQAREAEIQLGLERVRARTMAMHKSEELSETAAVLFQQFNELGSTPERMNICIIKEDAGLMEVWSTEQGGKQINHSFNAELNEPTAVSKIYAGWKKKRKSLIIEQSGKELADWIRYVQKEMKMPFRKELRHKRRVHTMAFFSSGCLLISTPEPVSSETINLLERFAVVFNLTYRRFLDLQKAEAQAREAQIEAALERVRSRTMAMHKSEELAEVVAHLFDQLDDLDIKTYRCNLAIVEESPKRLQLWATTNEGKVIPIAASIPFSLNVHIKKMVGGWKKQAGIVVIKLIGEERLKWTQSINKHMYFAEYKPENIDKKKILKEPAILNNFYFKQGFFIIHTLQDIDESSINIIKRFSKVFEQTYTRFLDLQKAEAQAREAQIETALERVRARTMAMHRSDELSEASTVLFEQLQNLGIHPIRCAFVIADDNNKSFEMWGTASEGKKLGTYKLGTIPKNKHPIFKKAWIAWEDKKSDFLFAIKGKSLEKFHEVIASSIVLSKSVKKKLPSSSVEYHYNAIFKYGTIAAIFDKSPKESIQLIIQRFTRVFEQTYTRFLDLQKAEAQAREAQIEAALERVRSRTMGMQKSEELKEVIQLVYEQFVHLKINVEHTGFIMDYKARDDMHIWLADKHEVPFQVTIPYFDCAHWNSFNEAKEKGMDFFANHLSFEEKNKFYKDLFKLIPGVPEETLEYYFSCPGLAISTVLLENVGLYIENFSGTPYTDEENKTLMRFGKVFQQTYTRFLDLQKAEAQAREAQIEAALERVRAQAMAMHKSDDLSLAVKTIFYELDKLNLGMLRCGIGILNKEKRSADLWTTTITKGKKTVQVSGDESMDIHPLLQGAFEAWLQQKDFSYLLEGEDLNKYYKALLGVNFKLPESQSKTSNTKGLKQYYYVATFKAGGLFVFRETEFPEELKIVIKRFADVFNLAYTRFQDLQQAEAQAREAVKQAALDRVRGEIASMRTSEDLNRITPIIWRELETLEVPFIRCGVFIVDEENKEVRVYLTTPDGKSLGALNLSFDANELTSNTVDHWKKNQVYKEHWNKEEFINWTKSMMELGQVQNAKTYQGSSTPPDSLDLHFVPFTQGMLYVGNVSPLTDEKLELVKTLAEAFSIAYARYEDFKNIEEAKNKIELTLNELKSAQAQLIHSEKMASLGELTAGIAHEIKNPLNFVNNFSDVSRELLDEMKEELQNKNDEEVLEIIESLKQNLEKINQHGKRADSIVKGMLLHSRGTSGEKMLTDINNLLDEYVNLAYHGMRAQNKEFNITMEKNYDKTLEKINVVPQDISRVFMNIISNACYAAYDKKKTNGGDFEPVLKVSTKNLNGKVEIRIGDNGAGIPADILDKVFQPFFTTKPTGEGTGLGLSLGYDIVTKVHGGDIRFESEEGEFTEFIITLPK